MSEPFVGEIRAVGDNFAPTGWALCNGQLLPISQNTALFSLLGTMYGGDGKSTFALPNLAARVPIHSGQGPGLTERVQGDQGGQEAVALIESEIPSHSHTVRATSDVADRQGPSGNVWATEAAGVTMLYSVLSPDTGMAGGAIGVAGSSQPHNNWPPYLTLNFIIALQGVFPPRS